MDLQSISKAIAVQSLNVDLEGSFRELAERSILRTTIKYFGQLNTASVHVNREGPLLRCTVNIQLAALKMMSAEFQHEDCYVAFKSALEKVENQLRQAKRELRENKARRTEKDMLLLDALGSPR
jgi:ribosomal subunit interface protein